VAFIKDPGSTVDYELDWTAYLSGETISTSTWSVPGLTVGTTSNTTTTTTVWLSGGTVGERYVARNTITTSGGSTDVRGITIKVEERNQ